MNQETVFENPGQEVHRKAQAYMDRRACNYREALDHVRRAEPDLWARYSNGDTHASIRSAGDAVDVEVRRRMRASGRDYRAEFYALWAEEREGGQKAAKETDFRTKAYMEHFGIKSYAKARERVLDHDPDLAVYDETGPTALVQLANLVAGVPRKPDHSIDVDAALAVIRAYPHYANLVYSAVNEAIGKRMSDWLANSGVSKPGMTSDHARKARDVVLSENPGLKLAYVSDGRRFDEETLRELFPQYFK